MGALAWLGVRMLAQDRDIERQRRRDILEVATGRLALDIDRRLQEIENQLSRGQGLRFVATGVHSTGSADILYQPEAAPDAMPSAALTAVEQAEFQGRDPAFVIATYRRMAASADPAQRAAALVGLARVMRRHGDREGALSAWNKLVESHPDLPELDVIKRQIKQIEELAGTQ